jgi:GT2 family glycosyltransferase
MARFPRFAGLARNHGSPLGDKAVLYLYPAFAAQIVRSLTLKAILTPVIVDRPASGFAPISRPALERAAGFTTLTLLPHAGRHTMAFIERLAASLPGLRLELGSDVAAIPAKIRGLLQHSPTELAALAQPAAQAPAKERPLVSVVVPVRNGASFLPGAVASIQAQNYPVLEIIVVDDGSTDDIQDVTTRLPAAIRYFRQEPSGPAAARNRGIREAKGELIAFLDVDDLWPADNLNIMVDMMLASPRLDVVQGYAQIMRQMPGSQEYEFIGCPLEVFLDYLGGALYRRSAFDKVGLLDESLAYCEDVDWFFRARDSGLAIERLDQISLYVRRHQQNMTRDGKQKRFALLVLKKIMAQRRARATTAEPHPAGAQPAAPASTTLRARAAGAN